MLGNLDEETLAASRGLFDGPRLFMFNRGRQGSHFPATATLFALYLRQKRNTYKPAPLGFRVECYCYGNLPHLLCTRPTLQEAMAAFDEFNGPHLWVTLTDGLE